MTESDSIGLSSPRNADECKTSYKKSNKPLMEKRRRARINSCLSQLKGLVLQAMKKDNTQYSKLEKADILELTVKHLRTVQRHQMAAAMTTSPDVINKYRAGFNECAGEVMRYLAGIPGIQDDMRTRVLGHLANCLQTLNSQPVSNEVNLQQLGHIGMSVRHPPFTGSASCVPNHSAFQTMMKSQPTTNTRNSHLGTQCLPTPVQFIPGTLPQSRVTLVLTAPVQAVPLYANPAGINISDGIVKREANRCFVYDTVQKPACCTPPFNSPTDPLPSPSEGLLCHADVWRPW